MTQEEALRMALEALEFVNQTGDTQTFDMCYAKPALAALKEALAHPEQEPVAGEWIVLSESVGKLKELGWNDDAIHKANTPQRTWVGLTNKEFAEILCDYRWQGRPELMMLQVQAKLKQKNTRGQE